MTRKHWGLVALAVVVVLPLIAMALKSQQREAVAGPWVDYQVVEQAPPIVDRTITGACPTGYQDHPADPRRCVLPIVLERRDAARIRAVIRDEERRARRRDD